MLRTGLRGDSLVVCFLCSAPVLLSRSGLRPWLVVGVLPASCHPPVRLVKAALLEPTVPCLRAAPQLQGLPSVTCSLPSAQPCSWALGARAGLCWTHLTLPEPCRGAELGALDTQAEERRRTCSFRFPAVEPAPRTAGLGQALHLVCPASPGALALGGHLQGGHAGPVGQCTDHMVSDSRSLRRSVFCLLVVLWSD